MTQQTYSIGDISKKKCMDCFILKPITDFHKYLKRKDGLCDYCKPCMNIRGRKYKMANREKMIEYSRHYSRKNRDRLREYAKEYHKRVYPERQKKIVSRVSKYRQNNKETVSLCKRKEYRKNIDRYKKSSRLWYVNNKEKVKGNSAKRRKEKPFLIKEWVSKNREKINSRSNDYVKKKKVSDPIFKLKCNMRTRMSVVFKNMGSRKPCTTEKLLGATWGFIQIHIENQFASGMSWDNYGEWHVDHKIPLASAKTKNDVIVLFNYKNLQPMWGLDNIIKNDKILYDYSEIFGCSK